jgi:acetylornithine deacetylase/succinyl-diaminopimelate desuccinylase-like protein
MKQIPDYFVQYTIEQCKILQQIPSPTFQENEIAVYLHQQFESLGGVDTVLDNVGNVLTRIQGIKGTQPIVISAHMDTVHPLGTDLRITETADRLIGSSIGDNSLGLAGLLTILKYFAEQEIKPMQDIWLVANTAEEGLGDLAGMKSVVNRFKKKPSIYLVLEGIGIGKIVTRGLSIMRFRFRFEGSGGHSWSDFGSPSAIHEMVHHLEKVLALPVPDECRTTINVGKISGGKSINSIAPWAEFELDLRSESTAVLEQYADQIISTLEGEGSELSITHEVVGNRPGGYIKANHPLVYKAISAYKAYEIEANLTSGSTDANIPLSMGIPALCIGLTEGGHSHTPNEFIELAPLSKGLSVIIHFLNLLWVKPKAARRTIGRKRE